MFKLKRLIQSLVYAKRGLVYVWRNEQNFQVQVLIALVVIIVMVVLHVTTAHAIILLLLIMAVLILEMLNTIFEKLVDILKPRIHIYVEVIKDMMAAIVLVAAVGAAVIALLIFVPYLVDAYYWLCYNI